MSDRALASSSKDSNIHIWRTETGELLAILRGHTDQVNGLAWLSGNKLVSSPEDKTIRIWSLLNYRINKIHRGQDY